MPLERPRQTWAVTFELIITSTVSVCAVRPPVPQAFYSALCSPNNYSAPALWSSECVKPLSPVIPRPHPSSLICTLLLYFLQFAIGNLSSKVRFSQGFYFDPYILTGSLRLTTRHSKDILKDDRCQYGRVSVISPEENQDS